MELLAFLIFYVNTGIVAVMMDYLDFEEMMAEYDKQYVIDEIGG